jgi:transcription termination factor Rho
MPRDATKFVVCSRSFKYKFWAEFLRSNEVKMATTTQQVMDVAELGAKNKDELLEVAHLIGLEDGAALTSLRREEVLNRIFQMASNQQCLVASGILEIMDEGYGFLRQMSYHAAAGDVYISQSQIRRFGLKTGDTVTGQVRPPKEGERYFGLVRVERVNDLEPDQVHARSRTQFEYLTPVFPDRMVPLETDSTNLSTRMIDLFSPIGLGQRGLVVSPPKAGKTTIIKQIAHSVALNIPDAVLMVALIGERPEEVTDMRRAVHGDVFASTFDESVEEQCRVAELALERAKRLVETGRDVIILLDSITRLARAYNLAVPSSGRTLSGGIDPIALYPPKKFFGAARNIEAGGSLTIIATCLVDTGSRMDEVIYEEFKGTGNMELHLDRKLADRRFFPAVDIVRSGTRREELLYDEEGMKQIWLLRRMISLISNDGSSSNATERVLERLAKYSTNKEFLENLNKDA